jgi:hypothetical protein
MKIGENDSITFHMTTPHTMQITMSPGMAEAIQAELGAAFLASGAEVVLVIDMKSDFKIG